jgi:hypothetical protein
MPFGVRVYLIVIPVTEKIGLFKEHQQNFRKTAVKVLKTTGFKKRVLIN